MFNKDIINQAKKYINKLLFPLDGLYYHQYNHSLDVCERAVYLGKKEQVSKEEIEILALASLFHDTGFVIQYDNNEYIGAKIARNYLRSVLYPENKIKIIEGLILATRPKYKTPKDILEKIIKDADLDNLGRDDFFEKKNEMKKELETIKNIKLKEPDWIHASIDLLNEHEYYTETEKQERGFKKIENKIFLEEMLKNISNKKEEK